MGGQKPTIKEKPSGAKKAPSPTLKPERFAQHPLSWHLSGVDFGGEWSWANLDSAHLATLHEKLLDYEQTPLQQLKRQKRAAQIPTTDVTVKAQNRLKTIKRDDSQVWELRLGHEKWRVWGVIRETIFYFLWWDPDHTVCQRHSTKTHG
jgi:hypothetical protein